MEATDKPTAVESAAGAAPTVLLAEDNEHLRGIFALVLRGAGFSVIEAADGAAAVQLAAEHEPGVVLMDLSLPKLDGWEATRRIRANASTAATPILSLSAFDRSTDMERAREAGCNAHLTKPVDPPDLIAAVREWAGERMKPSPGEQHGNV